MQLTQHYATATETLGGENLQKICYQYLDEAFLFNKKHGAEKQRKLNRNTCISNCGCL